MPTLAAQTVLRVRCGRPLRGPCIYLAYGRSLVRNSPRGWTPRPLTTIRWSAMRAVAWCRRRPWPLPTPGRSGSGCWYPVADLVPRTCAGVPADDAAARFGSTHANLRARESLRCPPSRRVPHKWSGRRPDRYTGRAAAFPVRNAEDCLSSEGGHRRLCAATSPNAEDCLSSEGGHRRLCTPTSTPEATSPELRDEPKKDPISAPAPAACPWRPPSRRSSP
ncbi:hypothetical protein C8J98_101795 [Luteibacter sp. OK325]|nr:hypothetical protein C8J98_101795 [Luteibacter sp. OK325]